MYIDRTVYDESKTQNLGAYIINTLNIFRNVSYMWELYHTCKILYTENYSISNCEIAYL